MLSIRRTRMAELLDERSAAAAAVAALRRDPYRIDLYPLR